MITDLVVQAIAGVLVGLASLLPRKPIDLVALTSSAGDLGSFGGGLDGYAPMTQLGIAMALVIGLKLALQTWDLVLFIYHQFWGSS